MMLEPTPLSGVMIARTDPHADLRGSFTRFFCESDLRPAIGDRRIVQINQSCTVQLGTIRGLHYQKPPFAETKLVRCLRGAAWDVVVDLRSGSRTFLRWHAVELTPENAAMMIVPEGCAHGFQTLTPECELLYLHTAPHMPTAEAGVAWDDPRVAIAWPRALPADSALSERDRSLPRLEPGFPGVRS